MDDSLERLRFDGVSKRFGGTVALEDVSFAAGGGSVHALVGENGAGKSTLMNILGGSVHADAGTISLDGRQVSISTPRESQRLGIAVVHQELTVAPHLSVAENIFLGRWRDHARMGVIDRASMHESAAALLRRLDASLDPGAPAGELSVAHQQMVEIARALSIDARVLVLDEPSAVLMPREVDRLFEAARGLTSAGVSIIYISHRMDEIFDLADDVTVLRDGRHVSTRPIGETTRQTLIQETVGRAVSEHGRAGRDRGEPLLRVERATSEGRFQDVSFKVCAGEVFCLAGLVGSGRSSVARAIFGDIPVEARDIRVRGAVGPFQSPRDAQRAGIAFIPEDRKRDGLLVERTLRENLTLANRGVAVRRGVIRNKREREIALSLMEQVDVRASGPDAVVATLSGGNQQKALIARWLLTGAKVFLFDEPTRGVDVGAKSQIYDLIDALAASGAAVLVISSELPEVLLLGDRIGVMCEGRLTGTLDNSDQGVTQEQIMRLAVAGSGN